MTWMTWPSTHGWQGGVISPPTYSLCTYHIQNIILSAVGTAPRSTASSIRQCSPRHIGSALDLGIPPVKLSLPLPS